MIVGSIPPLTVKTPVHVGQVPLFVMDVIVCYSMLWFDPHFSWLNLNVFLVCFLLVSSSLQELLGGALADGPPLILAVDGSRWCRAAEVSYDTQKPQQNNSIYGLAWKFNKKSGRHGIS